MAEISDEMLEKLAVAAASLNLDLGLQGEEPGKAVAEVGLQVSVSQEIRDLAIELGRVCGDRGLYRFRNRYVTVHEDEDHEADLMCDMGEDRFVSWVQNHVELTKWNAKEKEDVVLTAMTGVMARQVMAAHEFRDSIPKIRAVLTARMPVMRGGKPELLDVGYNVEEELYVVKDVPDVVDLGDEAMGAFEDLFGQMPFDSARSKAAFAACAVGMYGRYLFDEACAVPLFQFTANMEGAGKSLLAKCAIVPVYGSSGSSAYGDGDKFKEMLNSVANSGKGYVFFDDMSGSLFNQDLNRWVTDSTWEYRLYHTQSLGRVDKSCMTIISDNGCTLSDDLIRRSVIVSFHVDERAGERQKKLKRHLDEAWLKKKENRGRVLSIWWSFIKHWTESSEMCEAPNPIPSFRAWTSVVGGIVYSMGMGDAFAAAGLVEGGDKRRTEMDVLVSKLVEEYTSGEEEEGGITKFELVLGELCGVARENALFEYELGELHLIRQEMDSAPGKYYDVPTEGVLTEDMRHAQALVRMHPQKQASPFSKRLKKQLGMKFEVGGRFWRMSMNSGRHNKYVIEVVE